MCKAKLIFLSSFKASLRNTIARSDAPSFIEFACRGGKCRNYFIHASSADRPYPILNHQPIKEFDLGGTQTFQIILLKRVQVAPNIGGLYISRS
jgi:hypothetical protein